MTHPHEPHERGRVAHIITPTERRAMSLEEPSEASMATPPPGGLPWWQTVWAPVLVIILVSAGGAALVIWRDAPITSAEVRDLKTRMTASEAKDIAQDQQLQQLDKSVLLQGGEVRSNRDQIEALRKSLEKIESYYGATLREIQAINVSLAEVRGGLQKEGKMPPPER